MFSNLFTSKEQKVIQQAEQDHQHALNLITCDSLLFKVQQQLLAANKTSEPEQNIVNAFNSLGAIIAMGGMKDITQTVILSDHIIVLEFDKLGRLGGVTCDKVQ